MKKIFLGLIPMFFSLICFGQNDSLYLIALDKYSIQLDSFYTKYSDPNDRNRYKIIYLEQTDLINNIPEEINGRKLIILNSDNWKKIYHANNNSLIHLKVFPIKIENGEIRICFTPYHGELKRGHLGLGLSDWTYIYFRYDCESKKWKYSRSENDGI